MANETKLPISVLILVKDEEQTLKECLKQLDFASEIIVLDQDSEDKSVEIAKLYTKKIFQSQNPNFSTNRNKLLKLASEPWLLYIDADERLTPELLEEIKKELTNTTYNAFYFPRKNYVLGKWLKHGGWWPDYVPRLFRKADLVGWQGRVHESPQIKGDLGYFKNPIIHLTARGISQMFKKTIKWARIEAELNFEAKSPKVNILKVISAMTREFTKRYLFKLGILDGSVGLTEAFFQAYHAAIVLVYLWELQNKAYEKYLNADK